MVAAYGIGVIGRKLTYAEYVGLWLCRQRVLYRESLAVAVGISLALTGEAPGDFYDTLTDNPEQAAQAKLQAAARKPSPRRMEF